MIMKKLFTLIFALSTLSVYTQEFIEFSASEKTNPGYNILVSNDTLVKFTISIPGMFETVVDTFSRVNIKEHARMDSVGLPEIPIVSFLVAIPDCDSINLQLALMDSINLTNYNIYPAPQLVRDTTTQGAIALIEQFAYDSSIYATDAFFPGYVGEAVDKGAIRDQNVIRVTLYALQFNPVKKTLTAYSNIQVTLTFNNPVGSIQKNVGFFNEVVGNSVINYQSNGLNASVSCGAGLDNPGTWKWVTDLSAGYVEDTCDYLIITNQEFYNDASAKREIDSLAAHRASFNGFDVVIVKMDNIVSAFLTGTPTEKMFKLIRNTYNDGYANHTYDDKLAYVNLFGDVYFGSDTINKCVPTWPYYSPLGYDIYFTQLTYDSIAGDYDPYPDIMIGRCSVDDTEQVQNVVHKILHYKPDENKWKNNFYSVIGVNDPPNYSSPKNSMDLLHPMLTADSTFLSYDDDFNYSMPAWINFPYTSPNYSPIINKLSEGVQHYLYTGHGSPNGTSVLEFSDLNSSHNGKLFYMILQACSPGAFHNTNDCMTEQFLSADMNKGVIAAIGASQVVALWCNTIYIDLYNSYFTNYSYVAGENLFETKLAFCNANFQHLLNQYNLFGDPAINIKYENTDSVKSDLVVKSTEISAIPTIANSGDSIMVRSLIKNNSRKNISSAFYISCFVCNEDETDTLWIGYELILGLDDYDIDTVSFTWHTNDIDPGLYKIYIFADTSNVINEMDEVNNMGYLKKAIYSFKPNYPIKIISNNSSPITFDLNNSYTGEEIVFGENIFSQAGDTILTTSDNRFGMSSIANLYNNNENFHSLQLKHLDSANFTGSLVATGNPSWQYYFISDFQIGPQTMDMDSDGYEEIIVIENSLKVYTLTCINYDGSLKWDFELPKTYSSCSTPILFKPNSLEKSIILLLCDNGKVYYYQENINGNGLNLVDSLYIGNVSLYSKPVSSDIDKNGILDVVFCYSIDTSLYLYKFDVKNKTNDTKTINGSLYNYTNPIISDLDNDGIQEIILARKNVGLYVFDDELNLLLTVSDTTIVTSDITSGDFDSDFKNDIAYCTKADGISELKLFSYSKEETSTIPVFSIIKKTWLSDIDIDYKIDIVYSNLNKLNVINLPNAGSSLGWPGQHGNIRNSGVLLQPAYMPNTDTVYWYNTLLVTDSLVVDRSKTLVIKPGTVIKSDADSQILIYGKLIAEGTANHPIIFIADTMNANNDYWQGITFGNGSSSSLKHVKISNAEFGILYEDFTSQTLENCTFTNNTVGVGAFNSSPEIFECTFTNNEKGIGSYSNGSPVLTDLYADKEYRNAIVDNNMGIYVASGSVYLDEGYNDIYNNPASGYYVYSTGTLRIAAALNYWGSVSGKDIQAHLYPHNYILIDPICTSANTDFKSANPVKDLLEEAYLNLDEGEVNEAEAGFKHIISEYPLHNEAYLSVPGLFACYRATGNNWNNLETYLTGLYHDSTSTLDKNLLFGYLNLCLRQQGKYDEAITNYESIITNNPGYNDSVFAVINIGNTYREAGNLKSSLGALEFLKPTSDAAHVEKTIDLLQTLHQENSRQYPDETTENYISEIFPNPVSGQLTVKYVSSSAAMVSFQISDVNGRIIKSFTHKQSRKGENTMSLNTNFLNPGVYYVSLLHKGQNSSTKKIVVME